MFGIPVYGGNFGYNNFYNGTNNNNDKPNQKYICLFDSMNQFNFFDKMPRTFTISTNNQSCKFNKEIITQLSSLKSNLMLINPNNLHYHINIPDENNTLGKLEQLFQGKPVTFKKSELSNNQILQIFDINMGFNTSRPFLQFSTVEIEFNPSSLANYFRDNKSFKIKTNNGQYDCNYIGIFSSKVITEYIQSNPDANSYTYEFEDENNEFQLICDFFNFQKVSLSTNNALTVKKIADELKISFILSQINNFLDDYYDFSEKFDEEQETIDEITKLFDLLYNIDKKTVTTVKNSIICSKWIQTTESVQELAAFVIQVINSGLRLHRYLADLIFELSKESAKHNKLEILVPFICNKLMDSFGTSLQNCSFIFNLYKRGAIPENELNKKLKRGLFMNKVKIDINNNICFGEKGEMKMILNVNTYTLLWFLPEIIELANVKNKDLLRGHGPYVYSFIQFYFDKIDLYKKMREKGEPDDELTLAIRYDDVDKLQNIILSRRYDVKKQFVPFNMYEEFIPDCQCKYLNYCAAYGSIKCFKYILLNHDKTDNLTFKCAVYGGNTEIIKIVEQQQQQQQQQQQTNDSISSQLSARFLSNNYNSKSSEFNRTDPIDITIKRHQYDLFDWILEKKLAKSEFIAKTFVNLINISSQNGNIHSLVELLTSCFEYTKKFFDEDSLDETSTYNCMIESLCNNGFYLTTKVIMNVFKNILEKHKNSSIELVFDDSQNKSNYKNSIDPLSLLPINPLYNQYMMSFPRPFKNYKVSYGNLSILKLFVQTSNQYELENLLSYAIVNNYVNIVKYFFEHLIKKNVFQIRKEKIGDILLYCLCDKTKYLFDYVMEQIKHSDPNILDGFYWSIPMLVNACESQNVKVVKYITELILKERPNEDFKDPFCAAASVGSSEICNFFFDKKVFISFNSTVNMYSNLSNIKDEIFSILKKNISSEELKSFCKQLFIPAVRTGNASLVEKILKEKIDINGGLIESLENNNLEIAEVIIKYCNSKLLNQRINDQTALTIAVENNFGSIVELILNHEGFDRIESLFNYALFISRDEITEQLLQSKYLDINDTMFTDQNIPRNNNNNNNNNNSGWGSISNNNNNNRFSNVNVSDTLLIYSVQNNNMRMIDCIINHPKFDKKKSKLNEAVFVAISNNNFEIFKKVFSLIEPDINDFRYQGDSIISFLYCSSHSRFIFGNNIYSNEILNNPIISLNKEDINKAFRKIFERIIRDKTSDFDSKNLMNLIEYDRKHNNYINVNESLSPFYAIIPELNYKVFSFLLEIGFDPNIPDLQGVYLLQYALFLNAYGFIQVLIQSGKIDFDVKIPFIPFESHKIDSSIDSNIKFDWQRHSNARILVKARTTYLHLAAKCSNNQILKEFLDRKLIDVNVEDDFGNTPLFEACLSKTKGNIVQLFDLDDIDYMHCNKEGQDAMRIICPQLKEEDKVIQNKKDYFNELMNLITNSTA